MVVLLPTSRTVEIQNKVNSFPSMPMSGWVAKGALLCLCLLPQNRDPKVDQAKSIFGGSSRVHVPVAPTVLKKW